MSLNNQQWLICNKTEAKKSKLFLLYLMLLAFFFCRHITVSYCSPLTIPVISISVKAFQIEEYANSRHYLLFHISLNIRLFYTVLPATNN